MIGANRRRMILSVTVVLSSLAAVTACDAQTSTRADAAVAKLMPQCPSSLGKWKDPTAPATEFGFVLPLVAPLAGALVEKGVAYSAEWLKKFQDELSASTTARDVSTMYLTADKGQVARNGCLVFLRGELGSQSEFDKRVRDNKIGGGPLWTPNRLQMLRDGWKNERLDEEREARRARIPIVDRPNVYAEFEIRYDDIRRASQFFLKPVLLDYRATAAERPGAGKKDIAFVITFERHVSGAPNTFAKFSVVLPKTPIGSRFESDTLTDLVGALQDLPAGGDAKGPDIVPISVTVTMGEAEKAGDLERIFTETIDENKAKLGSAISARIEQWLSKGE